MRAKELYNKTVINKLKEKFGYKNINSVPKINKVVISCGIGSKKDNKNIIENIYKDINIIAGQKANFTKAKKAISGFKLRQGEKIGIRVTLRQQKMYDFIDRLVKIALPRIRDFRGLSIKGFDHNGNYNFGIKEHIVFPEIKYDKVVEVFSLQITINTTANNDKEALELLVLMGFPFEKNIKG